MALIVVAGILRRDGQILACQRRLTDRFPGRWEFPGGKLEPGESPAAALRRELEEELGIVAEIGDCLGRTTHQYPGFNPVELHFFEVTGFAGEAVNLAFEQIVWMDPAELPTLDFLEADVPLVNRLALGYLK
jgi:8-oxo-dGTP diphosphatase